VAEELLPLVYEELQKVANALFARQPAGHTLQPTALVHECWLKLGGSEQRWDGRSHFFSIAARAMRQILTDSARARQAERRGKGRQKLTISSQLIGKQLEREYELLDMEDALQSLATANERHAQVAELRLFGGLTSEEIAAMLGVTTRTIQMDWRAARAFLQHYLEDSRFE